MRMLLLAGSIVASLALAGPAQSHRLAGHPATLKGQLALAQLQLSHDRADGAHHWTTLDRRYVDRLRSRLRAAYRATLVPPHYAGWSCITNGAYPGAAHEGNGYNGAYSGPLGMSTPWMGYSPPGPDWVHSSVVAVYWIAERVAARYGFAYSWMSHQWPNTYPPCASRF